MLVYFSDTQIKKYSGGKACAGIGAVEAAEIVDEDLDYGVLVSSTKAG